MLISSSCIQSLVLTRLDERKMDVISSLRASTGRIQGRSCPHFRRSRFILCFNCVIDTYMSCISIMHIIIHIHGIYNLMACGVVYHVELFIMWGCSYIRVAYQGGKYALKHPLSNFTQYMLVNQTSCRYCWLTVSS